MYRNGLSMTLSRNFEIEESFSVGFLFVFVFFVLLHFPGVHMYAAYTIHVKADNCLPNETRCQLFWFENGLDRLHIIRYYCYYCDMEN